LFGYVTNASKITDCGAPTYRQFLLGSAYLNQGEEEKAVDLFLSAAGGVPQDTFLTDDLLNLSDTASGECI
jgi:hypothetical protein